MLVLTREQDQAVRIGEEVNVTVVGIRGSKVRLGISAPAGIPVHRDEVKRAIDAAAATGAELRELPAKADKPANADRPANAGEIGSPAFDRFWAELTTYREFHELDAELLPYRDAAHRDRVLARIRAVAMTAWTASRFAGRGEN
jgi:carbon storage regulator